MVRSKKWTTKKPRTWRSMVTLTDGQQRPYKVILNILFDWLAWKTFLTEIHCPTSKKFECTKLQRKREEQNQREKDEQSKWPSTCVINLFDRSSFNCIFSSLLLLLFAGSREGQKWKRHAQKSPIIRCWTLTKLPSTIFERILLSLSLPFSPSLSLWPIGVYNEIFQKEKTLKLNWSLVPNGPGWFTGTEWHREGSNFKNKSPVRPFQPLTHACIKGVQGEW